MAIHHIVTLVGSLRKDSFSLKIANALAKLTPASLKLEVTTLNGISFFNQDLEGAPPADWLAFREKLQKMERVPFALIIIGMVVLPIGYDFYSNGITMSKIVFGDILLLLAGLFWALDINMSHHISSRLGSQRITQLASFLAGLFALCLIVGFQIPFKIDITHMPAIAIIGIISIGMSTALFITGLKLIGAVRTILIYSINSAFGVVFSGVFLHENVTMASVISVSLAFLGIYLLRNRLDSGGQKLTVGNSEVKHD